MSILPEDLDRLLSLLGGGPTGCKEVRVVASFDDGYADALDYAQSRYDRFPNVDWMFFVCPAKIRTRSGFRWDTDTPWLEEARPKVISTENQRAELSCLGDSPACRLATVEELRGIATLPRVTLGNHSNCHFPFAELNQQDSRLEIEQSRQDFEALFGPTEHFAFPYGVPGKHFSSEHEQMLAAAGYRYLYTTRPRPYRRTAGTGIQRIHRFGVFGTWPIEKTALLIALIGLREKSRGLLHSNNEN